MKPLSITLAIATLGLTAIGCGSGDRSTSSAAQQAFQTALLTGFLPDKDKFTTANGLVYDGDDGQVRFYGHAASPADKQAIEALVRRYYQAAAHEDGAVACAVMAALTVEGIPEAYEELRGVRSRTCAGILTKVFAEHHRELVQDSASLEPIDIRVENGKALVLLRFAKATQPDYVAVHREGATWKLWEALAGQLP